MKQIKLILAMAIIGNCGSMYIRTGVGYSVGSADNDNNDIDVEYVSDTIRVNSLEKVNTSAGSGPSIELGLGYFFNENIGTELSLATGSSEIEFIYKDSDGGYDNHVKTIFKASYIPITASLVLKKDFDEITVFMSYGIMFSIMNDFTVEREYLDESSDPEEGYSDEYGDFDVAIGTQTRVGLNYSLTPWCALSTYFFNKSAKHNAGTRRRSGTEERDERLTTYIDEPGDYVSNEDTGYSTNTPQISIDSWGFGIGFLWFL